MVYVMEPVWLRERNRLMAWHGDCDEIRRSVRDITTMLTDLADWTIGDPDANARMRRFGFIFGHDVETMAMGRYVRLTTLANQCWDTTTAAGGDCEDLADELSREIADFMKTAESTAKGIAPGIGEYYDAAIYCGVAFLMRRIPTFTIQDLLNLCSPEVFTPYDDIGEVDETNTYKGWYGYDVALTERKPPSERAASSRVLGLMDKLPDIRSRDTAEDMDEYMDDSEGDEYDAQYHADHPRPDDPQWRAVFDSRKYNRAYAVLRQRHIRHDDDPDWPMDGRYTLEPGSRSFENLPDVLDLALDGFLCDMNAAFPGTRQFIPFMTDLDRMRRFVWKAHRAADHGANVDFDRITRAADAFRRRTWVRTTHTATGGME